MQKIKQFFSSLKISEIFLYSLLATVFLIPFDQLFISLFIAVLMVIGLRYAYLNRAGFTLKGKWSYFLFVAFYLVHLLSLTKGVTDKYFTDLEVKLSFVLFPALMILIPNKDFNKKKLIQKVFILSILLIFVISIIVSFARSIQFGDLFVRKYFTYVLFSILTHPSYNAMFTSLAFVFLINIGVKNNFKNKLLYISIGLVLILNVYLLSSKAGIYAFFAMLYFSVLSFYFWKRSFKKSFMYFLLVSILFLCFQKFNPRVSDFSKGLKGQVDIVKKEGGTVAKVSKTYVRLACWKAGVDIATSDMLFGVGIGNLSTVRLEKYKELNLDLAIQENYNFHNQYIETFAGMGIVGLVLLLSMFLGGLCIGIENKDYVLISFVIIVGINFLFESMLMKASGTIFFCLFFPLIIFFSENNVKKAA